MHPFRPAARPLARPAAQLTAALLQTLERCVPPQQIDELWIFPTFRLGETESTVAVVAAFDADPQRRRVLTAHLTSRHTGKPVPTTTHTVHEDGIVPAARVSQLLAGILRRLSDELAAAPTAHTVNGDPSRWTELLQSAADPEGSTGSA